MLRIACAHARSQSTVWSTSALLSRSTSSTATALSDPAGREGHVYVGQSGPLGEAAGRHLSRLREELRTDGLRLRFAVVDDCSGKEVAQAGHAGGALGLGSAAAADKWTLLSTSGSNANSSRLQDGLAWSDRSWTWAGATVAIARLLVGGSVAALAVILLFGYLFPIMAMAIFVR